MSFLTNKRILLGVTGGIAAYKSAELVRHLRSAGAEVRVVMTQAAGEFITPLTLQALSGHPVQQHLLDPASEAGMGHITLARWADVVLIAPASADFMAKLTHGLADDLLSTLCLATAAPLALAPAMNQQMWLNPATQANKNSLEERGVRLFGPAEGAQACGEVGPGRMLEPARITELTAGIFTTGSLSGARVLVSAGPTREAIDPVRYISNRSSGKMGYALAAAACEAGARVTLISGPTALSAPERVERIDVVSAREMHDAALTRALHSDIFIAAAAVADFHPAESAAQKIKKPRDKFALSLVRNPDILEDVAALLHAPFTVGFAAETENLELNAQAKRAAKKLDMIAANWVNQPGLGFDSDENELRLFWEGGGKLLARAPKERLARELIAIIAERYHGRL
ncbi:MAG TPA: bifunctional phosphopantothenoylcysteine decarboxylase/phosphopantothenate--cysteine ligase CoaBC [Gammaproteobacteria bacterium]|nr:bifunctional phosphopantothenoylcysteine decarboxylase/phosphopantothenate--cysteine ligase CoaBC [Gammaproteobacteria bacterium]